MGDEEKKRVIMFGAAVDGKAMTLPIAFSDKVAYMSEQAKCEIIAEPLDEPFTLDMSVGESAFGKGLCGKHGFTITGTASIERSEEEMAEISRLLNGAAEDSLTMTLTPDERQLPRKMKKGFRAKYRRDTKWKRKANSWRKRNERTFIGHITQDEDGVTFTGKELGGSRSSTIV